MSSHPHPKLTPEEYLAIERAAEHKSEYYDGEMFAMSGVTRAHSKLTMNLGGLLFGQLEETECTIDSPDLRVHIPVTGLYTYPDLMVTCGQQQFLDNVFDTLVNPTLIVEILSRTSEAYDRGQKFEHYRNIPSLQQYLLIAQDRIQVDLYTRQGDGTWVLKSANRLAESVDLQSIHCSIPLDRLYRNVLP
jgi:Uma2 family endonuclease